MGKSCSLNQKIFEILLSINMKAIINNFPGHRFKNSRFKDKRIVYYFKLNCFWKNYFNLCMTNRWLNRTAISTDWQVSSLKSQRH